MIADVIIAMLKDVLLYMCKHSWKNSGKETALLEGMDTLNFEWIPQNFSAVNSACVPPTPVLLLESPWNGRQQ